MIRLKVTLKLQRGSCFFFFFPPLCCLPLSRGAASCGSAGGEGTAAEGADRRGVLFRTPERSPTSRWWRREEEDDETL